MTRFVVGLSLSLTVLLSCPPAFGNPGYDYSVNTRWSGSYLNSGDDITSVELYDNYGTDYVVTTGLASGLSFFTLGDGRLQHVSSLHLPGDEQAVTFQGGIAYVVSRSNRLVKVAAYVPASPIVGWSVPLPLDPVDVAAWGQYLVIACGQDGLLVYDTTEQLGYPIGVVGQWAGAADQVEVVGDYAIVRNAAGITSVDLADPAAPVTADAVAMDAPRALLTDGTRALAGTAGGLLELDLADPAAMVTVRTITLEPEYYSYSLSLTLDGDDLYLADYGYVRRVDLVSGSQVSKTVGFFGPVGIVARDGVLAMAAGEYGLLSYSLKPGGPDPSVELTGLPTAITATEIAGDRLYVSGYGGTVCYDIAGAQPVLLWSHQGNAGSVVDLAVRGDMVYIGFPDGTVEILDNQGTPVGVLDTGTWPIINLRLTESALAVWTRRSSSSLDYELKLYALDDPSSPQPADVYATDVCDVMLTAGNTVVLHDRGQPTSNGGLLLDATDPHDLVVGSPFFVDPSSYVSVGDSTLYAVGRGAPPTLSVIDIANPYNPRPAPDVELPPGCTTLLVNGNAGYLGSTNLVFDLSDPLAPRPVGALPLRSALGTGAVDVGDGRILVSSGGYFLMPVQGSGLSPVEEIPPAPSARPLLKAYPNPFNPVVKLEFTMEAAGRATVAVYDARGRLVRRLGGSFAAGARQMEWNGQDARGRSLPSGVYFLRLETPQGAVSRKVVLAK